jgi:predicted PurR-regulated permease PerM
MTQPPAIAGVGRSNTQPLVFAVAVIGALYLAREVFIPLAFAIVLSLIWTPAVNWLQKLHVGRIPAVLLVVIASVAVAGDISWVIFNQLVAVVNELPKYQENIHSKITAFRSPVSGELGKAAERVEQIGKEFSAAQIPSTPPPSNDRTRASLRNSVAGPISVQITDKPASVFENLRDLARPFVGPVGIAGVVLIFSVFLLIERQDVRNRFLRLVGLGRLNVMTQALDDATQRVSRYLLLQFAVNAGFGLTIGLGLHFIGLPYAALWGTVAGLLRIVPYLGTLIAGVLPLVLSIAVFSNWMQPLLVFALFGALEIVIGNWVEPRLYGAHTGLSSLAILVATVFWTILWGPAGLILSMPLTVCVAVLGRHVPQLSFLHVLLGDEQVLTADAQVYQRLLAMDLAEAHDIAERFLEGKTLNELYDRVFVPALTMAEHDRHKGALDATRERFVFLSIKEMMAEFSVLTNEHSPLVSGEDPTPAQAESADANYRGRVLCVPASDEADEATAAMLAQLLEKEGITAIAFPVETKIQEVLALFDPQSADIVLLSSLPPFAFAQARTLTRQFRSKFPKTKLFVGVWGFAGDVEKALARFHEPRPDQLLTSFSDAVECIKGQTSA